MHRSVIFEYIKEEQNKYVKEDLQSLLNSVGTIKSYSVEDAVFSIEYD